MMDEYDAQPEAAAPSRPPFFARFWMVFVKPGELFRVLGQDPAWFPVTLFVALATAGLASLVPLDMVEEQMRAGGAGDEIDAILPFIRVLQVVAPAVLVPVFTLVVSAVTWVIFVPLRGDEATYRQHLCVVAHSGIISLAGTAVTIPMIIGSGNPGLQLSLGALAPFLGDGFLYNFLNALPLFQLWAVVVTGIGLAAVATQRRSAGSTVAVLITIQVIVALACAGFVTAVTPGG